MRISDWSSDVCSSDLPDKGGAISGIDAAEGNGTRVFHAGTAVRGGQLVANGGRVLNVTALGSNVTQAQASAYAAVDAIDFPSGFCRRDIGWREVEREERSEEHTSELQSLMLISYAVFCLKKKKKEKNQIETEE